VDFCLLLLHCLLCFFDKFDAQCPSQTEAAQLTLHRGDFRLEIEVVVDPTLRVSRKEHSECDNPTPTQICYVNLSTG
jgi:hypothetical protein